MPVDLQEEARNKAHEEAVRRHNENLKSYWSPHEKLPPLKLTYNPEEAAAKAEEELNAIYAACQDRGYGRGDLKVLLLRFECEKIVRDHYARLSGSE